jgi:hypothetical protein
MVTFDMDEEEKEHEIDMKTREITDIFRNTESLLKNLNLADSGGSNQADTVAKSNMQKAMAKKLNGLAQSFRRSQKVRFSTIYHFKLYIFQ